MSKPSASALSVEEALSRVVEGISPLQPETVGLEHAHERVLAGDVAARLTQPPFDASAMDGYAVRSADVQSVPCTLKVIGEAAAGHPFGGKASAGEAVRIFTGGAVPEGADTIVIQENTMRDGDVITVNEAPEKGAFVRPRGFDFAEGEVLLASGRKLSARDIALAATMNVTEFAVRRKPVIAILATGDELVPPGSKLEAGQIVSSIPYGLAPMVLRAGGLPEILGIASDTIDSLAEHIERARQADVLLTIGGASVGDHDFVQEALRSAGMTLDFWKIAMRPGKPLMFGQLGSQRVLGVPGNPVSALVCARLFLVPMIEKMLGLENSSARPMKAPLLASVEANGPRQHYMRATLETGEYGSTGVRPVRSQDSSLLSPLSQADCLIVRPPHAPAVEAGDVVEILPLDF